MVGHPCIVGWSGSERGVGGIPCIAQARVESMAVDKLFLLNLLNFKYLSPVNGVRGQWLRKRP